MRNFAVNHIKGIKSFLGTLDPFCEKMIMCTLLIALIELLTISANIIYGISSGTVPLLEVYIPIIKNIMIFTVIMLFFAFLFDSLTRRENINN